MRTKVYYTSKGPLTSLDLYAIGMRELQWEKMAR